jgi:hypothetical protein
VTFFDVETGKGADALERRPQLAAALKAAKKAKLAARNRDAAAERAEALRPVFAELAGLSTRAAAAELDRRTGERWNAVAVMRVRKRLGLR